MSNVASEEKKIQRGEIRRKQESSVRWWCGQTAEEQLYPGLPLEPGGTLERVIDNRIIEATMATAMDSKFVLNKVYGERGVIDRTRNGRGRAQPLASTPWRAAACIRTNWP